MDWLIYRCPTCTLLTADENWASFNEIYVEKTYVIKSAEYCRKQSVKLLKGRNKLNMFSCGGLWWHESSPSNKRFTGVLFKPAGKVTWAQLNLYHSHITHVPIQFLDPDFDSTSRNPSPHLLATNLPVPEHRPDHILGALYSCGSLYILAAVLLKIRCSAFIVVFFIQPSCNLSFTFFLK